MHPKIGDLDELAFKVTQKNATEPAWSSQLNHEKRPGNYLCIVCGRPLFSSADKFESGSGWPSFTAPINLEAIATKIDHSFFMSRTEVHCASCKAHMGHVFKDGPEPQGLRYCINGVALDFCPHDNSQNAGEGSIDLNE